MQNFRAFRLHNDNGSIRAELETLHIEDLSPGEVIIRAAFSSINYKDALAGTGRGKIMRRFPLICGIDVSGVVVSSIDARFNPGDEVLVTGCGLGEEYDGGYSEFVRVKADCIISLPKSLSLYEAMGIGTAGFAAALAVQRMETNGQHPDNGPIIVTGATGGVGSLAIDMLQGAGYEIIAVTGKKDASAYLAALGANEMLYRQDVVTGTRPLEKAQWAGAIDTVGGETLAWLTRTVKPWGNIASIGLAGGSELHTTVMPFILRGVSLLGVNTVDCPVALRQQVWERLGTDLRPRHLDKIIVQTITLDDLQKTFERILSGGNIGRTVVRI